MTNNEFVLKVLFSCRTLGQLKACREWVMDKYEFIDDIEIKPDRKRMMRRIDLHDTIREMEKYIPRIEYSVWRTEYYPEMYIPPKNIGDIISF